MNGVYKDLANRIQTDQVIIVENEDPEVALRGAIVSHIFTKRVDQGRAGFFPSPNAGTGRARARSAHR